MKSPAKSLLLVLVGAAFLAGCAKKPIRPEPNETVVGPEGGGNLNPQEVPTTDANASGLQPRGAEDFDQNGQMRGVLQPVYFDFDRSNIKPSERPALQAAKAYLDKNPQYRLLIEGHCDWRGTAEYNLALGDRRANEAKKYLVTLGVSPDRIDTVSKGSEDATKEGDASVWAKDRRDDLVVLNGQGAPGAMGAGAGATGAPAGQAQ